MAAAGAGDRGGRDARVSRDAVPRARAPRVAAPGAQRITLTGVMAVPDDFGRLRLLLLDERPDGAPDGSWGRLRNAVPRLHAGYRPPYEMRAGLLGSDADNVRGTVWIVLPAHRRTYWLGVAESLRGRWVTAEVTVRPFRLASQEGAAAAQEGAAAAQEGAAAAQEGAALDLAMLTQMADA